MDNRIIGERQWHVLHEDKVKEDKEDKEGQF